MFKAQIAWQRVYHGRSDLTSVHDEFLVVFHTLFVDEVASLVVGFHQQLQLVTAGLSAHLLFAECDNTQLQSRRPRVEDDGMFVKSSHGGLRFRQPYGVNLVVLQHLHPHVEAVQLYLKQMFLVQFDRVCHAFTQQVCCRKARHANHFVVQLLDLPDARQSVGNKLPVGTRHCHVAYLGAFVVEPHRPNQIRHHAFYPMAFQCSVAVHLCLIHLQTYTTVQRVQQLLLLCHEKRQTVQCRKDGNLQCCRVFPCRLPALLSRDAFCLFVTLSASH